MSDDLLEIFAPLNRFHDRIPLEESQRWLERTRLGLEDVRSLVHFHPERYVRNLMYAGPAFQALVLCWRNGQRSPIHDHCGSTCAVKVLLGDATETLFARAPNGMIYAVSSSTLGEGSITGSQDDDIHQISNLQAGKANLVTLHLYSPPLLYMNLYSLLDESVTRFFDPINDKFALGAGI
jgi:cysteine dioxygenase